MKSTEAFLAADLAADRKHIEVITNDDGALDEIHEIDCHQYAPEYNPTCAVRVSKNYGEKE